MVEITLEVERWMVVNRKKSERPKIIKNPKTIKNQYRTQLLLKTNRHQQLFVTHTEEDCVCSSSMEMPNDFVDSMCVLETAVVDLPW